MKFQLIRSATIKLYYENATLLIDPYFAEKLTLNSYTGRSKNPLIDLPITIKEITDGVDAVIISHMHSDHFDKTAKETIDKNTNIFCQPSDESAILDLGFINTTAVHDISIFRNIEMRRFDGQHGSGEVLTQMGLVSGFILKSENVPSICWLGDTILTSKIEELLITENPDIVIIHSSGAVWGDSVKILFDKEQTVHVCKILPNSKIIATHMDSLDHGTVSRIELREYADKNGISKSQLLIPADGDIILL